MLGSPKTDNQYHAGWAWAGSTPYKGVKLIASHLGGTRNPLAIRWPKKIKADAVPRDHFLHVNDVVPTIYDIVGIRPPRIVHGVPQDPIAGVSFARTLTDRRPGGKKTQYFEVMGSRGIYHDGWMASVFGPRVPWLPGLPPGIQEWTPDKDHWELYHLDEDWSQAHDLAGEMPESWPRCGNCSRSSPPKTRLPIGGGLWVPIFTPNCASRRRITVEVPGRNHAHPRVLRAGAGNKNNIVTVEADLPPDASGVLYALGGFAGGVTCYLDDGTCPTSTTVSRSCAPDPGHQTAARGEDRCGNPLCRARPAGPLEVVLRVIGEESLGRCRSARRCCSPPTTASTSASPRLTGVGRVLRQSAVPLQRPDRSRTWNTASNDRSVGRLRQGTSK